MFSQCLHRFPKGVLYFTVNGIVCISSLQYIVLSFQEPSASSPSVPALLASTLSFPVTHDTYTACLMTSAMATAGPCSAPGEVSASPSSPASSAPWLPPFSPYPDPPAPSLDRRMALSAKKNNWTPKLTTNTQKNSSMSSSVHSSPVSPGYWFFLKCMCVCLKMGVLMICNCENNRKKLKN